MKTKAIVIIISVCILSGILCIYMKAHINIEINADIINLHKNVITNIDLPTQTKENYKEFHFELRIDNDNTVKQRHVVLPDFKKLTDSSGNKIYWFGSYSIQDDPNQNFANYTYDITLNLGMLNEEDIRNIFNSQDFTISWYDNNDKFVEQKYKLGDLIKFK